MPSVSQVVIVFLVAVAVVVFSIAVIFASTHSGEDPEEQLMREVREREDKKKNDPTKPEREPPDE
jgi:flagellar biosynthesis/type III secretory pathway M-ring protein FliF/YscJ